MEGIRGKGVFVIELVRKGIEIGIMGDGVMERGMKEGNVGKMGENGGNRV